MGKTVPLSQVERNYPQFLIPGHSSCLLGAVLFFSSLQQGLHNVHILSAKKINNTVLFNYNTKVVRLPFLSVSFSDIHYINIPTFFFLVSMYVTQRYVSCYGNFKKPNNFNNIKCSALLLHYEKKKFF